MSDKNISYTYKEEVSDDHLRFLDDLYDYHSDRDKTIDGKLGQISGQSGLVLSILGLYIPLFYDKLDSMSLCLKIGFFVIFLIGFCLLLGSVLVSKKTLGIDKFNYSAHSTKAVLEKKSKEKFVREQIVDRLSSIKQNIELTNKKGSHLVHANRLFNLGLIVIAILGLILIVISMLNS